MTDYTPTNFDLREAWTEYRADGGPRVVVETAAFDEFYRWLAAHDQGIRDAVKLSAMTAREHLEAAWEAAYEVPEGQVIPKGTRYLLRISDHEVAAVEAGIDLREGPSARTLDPLPPVIPDDCMAVWASVAYSKARMLWVRDIGSTGSGNWSNGDDVVIGEALIDPKPVPEEER